MRRQYQVRTEIDQSLVNPFGNNIIVCNHIENIHNICNRVGKNLLLDIHVSSPTFCRGWGSSPTFEAQSSEKLIPHAESMQFTTFWTFKTFMNSFEKMQ